MTLHLEAVKVLCVFRSIVWGIAVISSLMGLWFMSSPRQVLNWHTALYKMARWRVEPLDFEAEVRFTRGAGVASLILGLVSIWILVSNGFQHCPFHR